MLGCSETITVYHPVFDSTERRDIWTAVTIEGCSWYSKLQVQATDKGVMPANLFYVRIPLTRVPENLVIGQEDIVARGKVEIEHITPAAIMQAYDEAFKVMSHTVNDQCSEYSRHIRIQGAS